VLPGRRLVLGLVLRLLVVRRRCVRRLAVVGVPLLRVRVRVRRRVAPATRAALAGRR
jgi:hypothetical protein